ncbi:unnamed protein product [Paramecium sonneborni]|uniref:Uncharacterized protein n=1 Tax=Paramecium sonneborni TaxID=65129 RepID=A0A8S1LX46_9CILI|nr:unnamed protein product [Paramecium sonneborni]
MMNYQTTMDQVYTEDEQPICDPSNYTLQYISRMMIISISLLSSGFIGLTCVLSRKRSFWIFKILSFQSLFECTDLLLALIFNRQLMEEKTLIQHCGLIGYIMHSSWISSFFCCLLMVYQMNLLLKVLSFLIKVNKFYETLSKNVIYVLLSILVLPYFWLLIPYLLNDFVPTGWNSYQMKCSQYFFCGFDKDWILYLIFWTLPQVVLFLYGFKLVRKNYNQASLHLSTFQDEEFKIIKKLQVFPEIYSIAWIINQLIRYVDIIPQIRELFVNNEVGYAFYILLNLVFELHLVIVMIYFLKNYNKVLNVKQIWLSIFCCQQKVERQQEASLLYEDVNQTS